MNIRVFRPYYKTDASCGRRPTPRVSRTVVAKYITDNDRDRLREHRTKEENRILELIRDDKKISISQIALQMNWLLSSGEPHKSRVFRVLESLKKGRKPLVAQTRTGCHHLTDEGYKALSQDR